MAFPTYLDLVNDVLVRLREPQVTTVSRKLPFTALVGKFVNDAKRQGCLMPTDWDAFNPAITVSTTAGE